MQRMRKTKIVLVQLGSPKSPSIKDVRSFLREFLGDPRVVDINPILWKVILNLFVIPFRPYKSAKLYERIWDGKSFPLIDKSLKLGENLDRILSADNLEVDMVFVLSNPRFSDIWDKWEREDSSVRAHKWIIIPMFPQYSEATTASVKDVFFGEMKKHAQIPAFEFISNFHNSKAFIENSAGKINEALEKDSFSDLVISFHGIPKRRPLYKGDPYYQHCFETYELIKERVSSNINIHMTFQSRFGSEEWLTPYTDEYVMELVDKGAENIAVYCPSFVTDCLETIDEIGHELKKEVEKKGGKLSQVECLNNDENWQRDFADFIKTHVKENDDLLLEIPEGTNMPKLEMKSEPLSDYAKASIKIVFLTLFLDLVGFSLIFPLFPALAKHYLLVDGDNFFLKAIFDGIGGLTFSSGKDYLGSIVLFGGALGALYSLLQFVAAPIWGVISDRVGRKPVLLISVFGMMVSYILWFFSGSFTLLILARFIGGIMGGNISTATAVVADVTNKKNRVKGMAFVGIAFATGFIIGPAMGGILSLIDLTKIYPQLSAWGVNPFSAVALLAFLLSLVNFIFLLRNFKETLPKEKRLKGELNRTFNPLKLFKPLPYKGVNLTNFGHFFFLMAFSGMEFTLTFLAVDRLGFSPMDNAYLFIFIGFVLALVQGGIVRRKAAEVGERKMALIGLVLLIPGLFAIGVTETVFLLYVGLFFLAVGGALIIPCLTALVSIYTPDEEQGKSIGIFRSLGALARVFGPILGAIIYWKMGSGYPYFIGALFLIVPIIMIRLLPEPELA
ncbi:MAG: ferrochelatase [Deltaproteobacteria bacterium]|nr:MAG: ferrochelatase [Deltaproteobacteria bacterium]